MFFELVISCLDVFFIDGFWFVCGVIFFDSDFLIRVLLFIEDGVIVLFKFEIVGVIEFRVDVCVVVFRWFLFNMCWDKFVKLDEFKLFILIFGVIGCLM